MTLYEVIQSVAAVATAIGVGFTARQLYTAKLQAQSDFEDSLNEQYRRIANELPLAALLGKVLNDQEMKDSLKAFYNYFDLSNEQIFLSDRQKIRPNTWDNWKEGIEQHMRRPAFDEAFKRLEPDLGDSFERFRTFVRKLAAENYKSLSPKLISQDRTVSGAAADIAGH